METIRNIDRRVLVYQKLGYERQVGPDAFVTEKKTAWIRLWGKKSRTASSLGPSTDARSFGVFNRRSLAPWTPIFNA